MCRLILLFIFIALVIYFGISYKTYDFAANRSIQVEIKGEVVKPIVIETNLGATLNDIISNIDLTDSSDVNNLPLLERLHDKQIINIPKKKEGNLVSINEANIYELSSLPGIGESIAKSIIDYRNEFGSFIDLLDLKNVNGIGDKKYEKIKSYICL